MAWNTINEFERDLAKFSEFNENDYDDSGEDFTPTPPKSVAEYKARTNFATNRSIYDTEKQDVCYFISGRGKFIKDRAVRPGEPVKSTVHDDAILEKMIREVTGLGYANEMIEHRFRATTAREDESGTDYASEDSCSSSQNVHLKKSPLELTAVSLEPPRMEIDDKVSENCANLMPGVKKINGGSLKPLPNDNFKNLK